VCAFSIENKLEFACWAGFRDRAYLHNCQQHCQTGVTACSVQQTRHIMQHAQFAQSDFGSICDRHVDWLSTVGGIVGYRHCQRHADACCGGDVVLYGLRFAFDCCQYPPDQSHNEIVCHDELMTGTQQPSQAHKNLSRAGLTVAMSCRAVFVDKQLEHCNNKHDNGCNRNGVEIAPVVCNFRKPKVLWRDRG
jgi:hypothetical protein